MHCNAVQVFITRSSCRLAIYAKRKSLRESWNLSSLRHDVSGLQVWILHPWQRRAFETGCGKIFFHWCVRKVDTQVPCETWVAASSTHRKWTETTPNTMKVFLNVSCPSTKYQRDITKSHQTAHTQKMCFFLVAAQSNCSAFVSVVVQEA